MNIHPLETCVFDHDDVEVRFAGHELLLERVLERFLQSTPARLQGLRDALAEGDTGTAGAQAHALKGSSATVGGAEFSARAGLLEGAACAGELAQARAHGEALADAWARLQGHLAGRADAARTAAA